MLPGPPTNVPDGEKFATLPRKMRKPLISLRYDCSEGVPPGTQLGAPDAFVTGATHVKWTRPLIAGAAPPPLATIVLGTFGLVALAADADRGVTDWTLPPALVARTTK